MVKILHHNVLSKSFIFLILLAVAGSASAQTFGSKVRLGFRLDPGGSVMRPQESGITRNGGKFYFSYGVMADFYIDENSNYALSTGLGISHMGSVLKYEVGKGLEQFKAEPTEYDLRLQYVEIPFALKLKTNTQRGIGIWGQFGAFAGFPVRARANVISGLVKYDRENVLQNINRFQTGMLLGAGVEYPLTETLTGIAGFNFQNGFTDITRNRKWDDGRVNMNAFVLRLGVYF